MRLNDCFDAFCPNCERPHETIRPGKTQPTCDCDDYCEECGTKMGHYALGEISENEAGWLCPVCDVG